MDQMEAYFLEHGECGQSRACLIEGSLHCRAIKERLHTSISHGRPQLHLLATVSLPQIICVAIWHSAFGLILE